MPRSILFYGTDTLSTTVLQQLRARGHDLLTVTKSHQTPVYKYCKRHDLPVDVFTRELPFGAKRDCLKSHTGVVASFGSLIPGKVIRSCEQFVNVHPSAIPKYQGAAPLQHVLLNGEETSAVTILEVLPRTFDSGNILAQVPLPIPRDMTGRQVWTYTGEHMARTLSHYLDNPVTTAPRAQDSTRATPAPKILKHQLKILCHVCPQTQTASQIFNIARLVDLSKFSVAVCWDKRRLKLKSVHVVEDPSVNALVQRHLRPGQFVFEEGVIMVACAEGTVLGVTEMILPFSHVLSAERFYRDHSPRTARAFYMVYNSEEEEVKCG